MPRQTLSPLPLAQVTIDSGFWGDRLRLNREHTIPTAYAKCKDTGRIDAFKLDWKPGQPNLNTHVTVVEPGRRWTNLRDWHERYCAGHMIEAGGITPAGRGAPRPYRPRPRPGPP